MDVPVLGAIDAQVGFGLNAAVRDHVVVVDQGRHAVCVVGNRLAFISLAPSEGITSTAHGAPAEVSFHSLLRRIILRRLIFHIELNHSLHQVMTFLPHARHVKRVTAICADPRRKTLAVCVEVDIAAESSAVPVTGSGADAEEHPGPSACSAQSPFQVRSRGAYVSDKPLVVPAVHAIGDNL
jgi:hypothetical protein